MPVNPNFDYTRAAQILGMCGSIHQGERLNAVSLLDKLLRKANMTWSDLLKPHEELQIAIEAAQKLLEENGALRIELERYRGVAAAAIAQVGISRNPYEFEEDYHLIRAQWALGLHAQGLLRLNSFEEGFLGTVSRWHGELTERQKPVWDRMLSEICQRCGRVPP